MKNSEIVKILTDIGDLLELKGENIFKARAYQKAARSIEFLSEEVDKLIRENRLREVPGIGEAIEKKLTELVTTGRLEYYERLKAEFPEGIGTFLDVPGIGPRTALLLTRELKITTIEDLEKAIEDGRVAGLARMGEKTAGNILHQIKAYRKKKGEQRIPLGRALAAADSLMEALQTVPGLKNLMSAGSLRRFRDTIGDIDLVGSADNPEEAIQAFTSLPQVCEVLEKGTTKASVIAFDGIQADIRVFDPAAFGSALQYSTGSKQHCIDLRTRAERKGFSLSEYGITVISTGHLEEFSTEDAFYRRQGLDYIPPEIREGTREIELAEKGDLPRLVELSDIKGDLHVHTTWSDGNSTLETMVESAVEKGYHYLGITDHALGLGITGGLTRERLHQQIEEIKVLARKYPSIRILSGMEIDIKASGALDIPDELLDELDIIIASVHSSMNQSEEQMTRRIIRAIENPHVDIIAHPTSRLLGEREAASVNLEAVFNAAAKHNTALEINAMPTRLDLKDIHIFQAREMGVKLVINTDAHRSEHMDYMHFGVGTARRGWCETKDILNTLPPDEFLAWLAK
jgi:DNA polymerase (family 10)